MFSADASRVFASLRSQTSSVNRKGMQGVTGAVLYDWFS